MMSEKEKGFGSDNFSGILPEVLQAITEANTNHVHSYGDDKYTELATKKIREIFGCSCPVFFVFNGTGANTLSLSLAANSYHAVVCADTAHIAVDECGAIERHVGCRLFTINTPEGKLTPRMISRVVFENQGDQHRSQPKVISISQCTELGTVYTPDEIRALADFAHQNNMYLHVDGARLANALAYSGCSAKEMITDTGVDVLSFGGTKNGMMIGEAVVVLNPELSVDGCYIRKQLTQLGSKMRFISAQFNAILEDGLWLKSASHANSMAQKLLQGIRSIKGMEPVYPVQANAVFMSLPAEVIPKLQEQCFFYVWQQDKNIVRWVCSFDTTEQEVGNFIAMLKKTLA